MGSKDWDDSLVVKKKLIQKMACWVGTHSQVNLVKKVKLWYHLQKSPNPKRKYIFFQSKLEHLLNL